MYVKKLLDNYSGPTAGQLLTRVALHGGFLELPDLSVEADYKDDFYNSIAPEYIKLSFHDWNELYDEISEKIASFNNNEIQISRYVCSILMPFNTISRFLYPEGNDRIELIELSSYLKKYAGEQYNAKREKEIIRKQAEEKFKDLSYVNISPDGKISDPISDFINDEERKICMTGEFLDHKFLKEIIYTISRLASAIEGSLLINGAQNGLFEYQRICGVVLSQYITAEKLCYHLGWTDKMAKQLLPAQLCYKDDVSNEAKTGYYRQTDVIEVDRLLAIISSDDSDYAEDEQKSSIKTFSSKCKEMANSNLSNIEKEVWIAKILEALGYVYVHHSKNGELRYKEIAIQFWAVLEAEFLASPEQICVRKVARDLSLEQILDEPYNNKDQQYIVSDNPEWKKPYGWCYSELWPRLGRSTHYHEKRICEVCNDSGCKYRYGVKNLTVLEKEYSKKKSGPKKRGRTIKKTPPTNIDKQYQGKQAETSILFSSNLAKFIISAIRRLKCVTTNTNGQYQWTGEIDLYAYMCYKLCDTILPAESQYETRYIFENIISADYVYETVRSYVERYRRGIKVLPKGHETIDNIINNARGIDFRSVSNNGKLIVY